jgi:thiamine-phosphate pyrophosphorylase
MEIMGKKRSIESGVYVVLDPFMDQEILLYKLNIILEEPVAAVQLWDHFSPQTDNMGLIGKITKLCHGKDIPVIINNHWEWLSETDLDGVHFDLIPGNFGQIKDAVTRDFICGLTCSNDLSLVKWADDNHLDYISFCSVFPSATSNSCELVKFETICQAKRITAIPVFLAGGINPENMHELKDLPYEGVAVISGIMRSETPGLSVRAYIDQLKRS